MAEKTTILFTCSVEFKQALGEYAQTNNTDVAKIVRRAVADLIGYDMSRDFTPLGRRRVYATDAEREEARKKKAKEDRDLRRALIEAYKHDEHIRNVVALQQSLERKEAKQNGPKS